MLYFVYDIKEKQTGLVGYTGVTIDPERRMKEHLAGKGTNGKRNEWLLQTDTEMEIRAQFTKREQAYDYETKLILEHQRNGMPLTNLAVADTKRARAKKSYITYETAARLVGLPIHGTLLLQLADEFGWIRRGFMFQQDMVEDFKAWLALRHSF